MAAPYTFAKGLKSETKIAWIIYAFDFFFIIIFMVISHILSNFVSSKLHILYYIFSGIVALLLTLPSRYNHKRRMYQSLLLFLKKEVATYHPIRIKEKGEQSNADD